MAHHDSKSFGIKNMPHEILHFCQANAKRFFVTTTLDRENKEVIQSILISFHFFFNNINQLYLKNMIDMIVSRFIVYVLMSRVNLAVENLESYEG